MIRQREGPALRRQQDTPGPEASEQQQLRVTQGHALVVAPAPASVERRHQLGTLSGRVEEKRGGVQDRRRQVRAASFVAALAEKSIAPFLLPAH
jgi:hypothetical protein